MKIFCDESGYTGSDLLDSEQEFFVYCGVNLNDDTTKEIIHYIEQNYNLQGSEIKGKNLVSRASGRKVIEYIFKNYSHLAKIVIHNKKYVLAAKIVEYGIEPALESNWFFYESKLNQFIAFSLYSVFISNKSNDKVFFEDFLKILQGKLEINQSELKNYKKSDNILKLVTDIVLKNQKELLLEITTQDGKPDKWLFDLTITSLLGILTNWSMETDENLDVTCDNSKVFDESKLTEFLNGIGLSKGRMNILDTQIGFNLSENIKSGDSKIFKELQIADLFSSTVNYCLKNPQTDFSKTIMKIVFEKCLCRPASFSVMPDSSIQYSKDELNMYQHMFKKIYIDVMNRKSKKL